VRSASREKQTSCRRRPASRQARGEYRVFRQPRRVWTPAFVGAALNKADELNKKIMAAITMERCFGAMAAVTNGEDQENSRHRLT
jgi:hypothetical protein